MTLTHIKVAKDLQELTIHGSNAFPIALYETTLQVDRLDFLPLHWHKEIQFVYVKSGRVNYRVGADIILLEAGEGLFVNAACLHEAKPNEVDQSLLFCINVDPKFLGGHESSVLTSKYVQPYIANNRLPFVKLSGELAQAVERVAQLLKERNAFFEFQVWRGLLSIWEAILMQSKLTEETIHASMIVQHERAKEMLDYIHCHYQEKITLEKLAAHVFISKAECSRFFKKVVGMTPFTYLSHYRLRKSMELLRDRDKPITFIASDTGFSTVSYYIERFKAYTGYSPHAYRKKFLVEQRNT